MTVIKSTVDAASPEFRTSEPAMRALVADLQARRAAAAERVPTAFTRASPCTRKTTAAQSPVINTQTMERSMGCGATLILDWRDEPTPLPAAHEMFDCAEECHAITVTSKEPAASVVDVSFGVSMR